MKNIILQGLAVTLCVVGTAVAGVPSAPQNLTGSWLYNYWPSGFHSLLWWEPVPGATSYTIYQFDESSSTWGVSISGLTEPLYRNFLPPVPPTRYAVTASNADGESAVSNEAVVDGNMFNFMITGDWPEYSSWSEGVTPTNAWVSWSASNSGLGGVDGMLELSTNGTDFITVMQNTNYQGWHNALLTNLTPRTFYHYRVTTVGTNRGGQTMTRWFATEDTNHPPVVVDVNVTTVLSAPTIIQLGGNDSLGTIPFWGIQSFRVIQGPTNGTLSATTLPAWNNVVDVTYTPSVNRAFEDHFWYVANDGDLDSALGLVTITNIYINRPPEGGQVIASVVEGVSVVIELIGSDPDGDILAFTLDTNYVALGAITGTNSSLVYTPPPGYAGGDSFGYWVSDGTLTASGVVLIEVLSTNSTPTAASQSLTVPEDGSHSITLTGSDANGDLLTYRIATPPANGELIGNPPNVVYQPAANYNGTDQFAFVANDGRVDSAPATVSLTITPVNDAPISTPRTASIAEDSSLDLDALTAFDVDGDTLTFTIISGPQHGQIVNGFYVPALDYAGADTLAFVANDGQVDSSPATLSITILNVNDPPVPGTAPVSTLEDTPVNIVLTAYNPDNDPLTFILTGTAASGTATADGPNATFVPTPGASGPAYLDYAVSDGTYWATGRVVVNITSVEDVPEADGQSVATAEDLAVPITLVGSDGDQDPITYFVVNGPAHGSLNGSGPNLVYTPSPNFNGTDSFTFKVNDGKADSAPSTVIVSVAAVNDTPTFDTILNHGTAEDGPAIVKMITGISSGAANEVETITVTAVSSNPALIPNPTVSYTSPDSTGSLTLRALTNANGIALITVTVSDGAISTSRTFNVQISALNDPPTINPPATVHVLEDAGTQVIQLSGISGGPTDEPQAVMVSISTTHESLTGIPALNYTSPNSTGTITFTPPTNANGLAAIQVTVSDGIISTVQPVQIWIDPVNDAPVANGQSVTTPYNMAANIALTGSDVDGSTLSYAVLTSPANGTLSGNAPNLTFTPNLNWSGTTSFTFRVNDGSLHSAAATVTLTVNSPNAVPLAPSGLTAAVISRSRIDLAWSDNSNVELGFKVERSTTGTSWTQVATVGPNVRSYSSTGLSANKLYYYRVRAYNSVGDSPYSNTITGRTMR